MQHAADKLEAVGATLPFPHSSQVRGALNLRELRPRARRSPWRAFYRRVGDALVIAAIGPEAKVDPQGFRAATSAAERRLAEIDPEGGREEEETMKVSETPTQAEVTDTLLSDPEFRAEWDRTALGRAVAIAVVKYRADHGLSQRKLAEQLGWKQPAVARLELGEYNPSFATLCELAQKLDLELVLDITPKGLATAWFNPAPADAAVLESTELADGTRIAFATRPAA
jgi:transcriptional regulator with XRE-family HTH domain